MFLFYSNLIDEGYEELEAPDFIQTVTAPSLNEKSYDEFRFQRTEQPPRKDQDYPFDNSYQGKIPIYISTKSQLRPTLILRCLRGK